jgi:hypothetical protein
MVVGVSPDGRTKMNKFLLHAAVAIAFAVCHGRGWAQETPPRATPGQVGRYQLVAFEPEGRIYLLDTATGQCWSRAPGGDWRDDGNPTLTKVRRVKGQTNRSTPGLNLQEKSVEMIVVQREERAIPGSDGSVRVRLGDITEGQALLSIVTADGEYLLERASVTQGDTVRFFLRKKQYAVHIKELRNILIGDDFAKITVSEAEEGTLPRKSRSTDRAQ